MEVMENVLPDVEISEAEWQLKLIKRIQNLTKEQCVQLWLRIVALEEAEKYTEQERIEHQADIDEGEADIEAGRFVEADAFLSTLKQRYA